MISVDLRGPFEYEWWVFLIAILVLLASGAFLAFMIRALWKNRSQPLRQQSETPKQLFRPPFFNIYGLKRSSIHKVQKLAGKYDANQITRREGYQELSYVMRNFVEKATGIKVGSYTLEELRKIHVPALNNLIHEYYIPEFAEDSKSTDRDFPASCRRAMEVIHAWR